MARAPPTPIHPSNYQWCEHCNKLLHRTTVWRHRAETATAALPPLPFLDTGPSQPGAGPSNAEPDLSNDSFSNLTFSFDESDMSAAEWQEYLDPFDEYDPDAQPPPHPSTPLAPIPILSPIHPLSPLDELRNESPTGSDEANLNITFGHLSLTDDNGQTPSDHSTQTTPHNANAQLPPTDDEDDAFIVDGDVIDDDDDDLEDVPRSGTVTPESPLPDNMSPPGSPVLQAQPDQAALDAELALIWDLNASRHRIAVGMPEDSVEWRYLKTYKLRMETNMGYNAYAKLRNVFQEELALPSLDTLRHEMRQLTGIEPRRIDCCRNSCTTFSHERTELTHCPHCGEPRWKSNGDPYNQFLYFPLIPQVQSLYAGVHSARSMRYRSEHQDDNTNCPLGTISDIYDSALFRTLRDTFINVDGEVLEHKYFQDPRDVLLVQSTDGFNLFKRGKHTAWPLIFFNMNLSPKVRCRLGEAIWGGFIPGPKKPTDHDAFTRVIVDELLVSALGVMTYDAVSDEMFRLRIFAPWATGDIPAAASAYTGGKQQGAVHPCRTCTIEGVRIENTNNTSYYLPITRPPTYPPSGYTTTAPPPLRNHNDWIEQANAIETAPTNAARERLSRQYGIVRLAITHRIPGWTFPWSTPYEYLHLMYNMCSNYLDLFGNNFKGLDNGVENYIIPGAQWKDLGRQTVLANKTIPSAFGRSIVNIAEDRTYATGETYLVWCTIYSPVLLRRVLPDRYYKHWRLFLSILETCLAYETTAADRARLRVDIAQWINEYERYFYQYLPERLATCLLTVHGWLHSPDLIEQSGPVWTYWSWETERACGILGKAVQSKKHPFASMVNRVQEMITVNAARHMYDLQDRLPPYTVMYNSSNTIRFSVDSCPGIEFLHHSLHPPVLDLNDEAHKQFRKRIAVYLATQYNVTLPWAKLAVPDTVTQWARIRVRDDDIIRTSLGCPPSDPNERDASFAHYELLVDRLAHRRNARPDFEWRSFFGRVDRAFVLKVPASRYLNTTAPETLLLADISMCDAKLDGDLYWCPDSKPFSYSEVINTRYLQGLIGRIIVDHRWYIVQRSGIVHNAAFNAD